MQFIHSLSCFAIRILFNTCLRALYKHVYKSFYFSLLIFNVQRSHGIHRSKTRVRGRSNSCVSRVDSILLKVTAIFRFFLSFFFSFFFLRRVKRFTNVCSLCHPQVCHRNNIEPEANRFSLYLSPIFTALTPSIPLDTIRWRFETETAGHREWKWTSTIEFRLSEAERRTVKYNQILWFFFRIIQCSFKLIMKFNKWILYNSLSLSIFRKKLLVTS